MGIILWEGLDEILSSVVVTYREGSTKVVRSLSRLEGRKTVVVNSVARDSRDHILGPTDEGVAIIGCYEIYET